MRKLYVLIAIILAVGLHVYVRKAKPAPHRVLELRALKIKD